MQISKLARVAGLTLATLFCASGAFAAEGSISTADATLKISNTTLKPGETLSVTFSTTPKHNKLSPCSFEVIVRGLENQNYLQTGPTVSSMVYGDPPQVTTYNLTQPGKYRALAVNYTAFPGACGGLPNGTIVSSPLQIDFTVEAPLSQNVIKLSTPVAVQNPGIAVNPPDSCPNPYDKYTQGVNTAEGEYYCVKANISCPQGFTGSMDQSTGKMTCTPIITATCPAGWSGGVVGGQLVCNSIPQPQVACKYVDNNGGTSYYKESWNKMGCSYRIVPK